MLVASSGSHNLPVSTAERSTRTLTHLLLTASAWKWCAAMSLPFHWSEWVTWFYLIAERLGNEKNNWWPYYVCVTVTASDTGTCSWIDKFLHSSKMINWAYMLGHISETYPNVVSEYEIIVFPSQIQPESRIRNLWLSQVKTVDLPEFEKK